MRVLAFVFLVLLQCAVSAGFKKGDRVLARWRTEDFKYHGYYRGTVVAVISSARIYITFDDGAQIAHWTNDKSAVIVDEAPDKVDVRDQVMATWKGSAKYYLGFIIKERESDPKYEVLFDDGDSDWYNIRDLRKLPSLALTQIGARVWGQWSGNNFFYRGFVEKRITGSNKEKVRILFDDGDTQDYYMSNVYDKVVLDLLPSKSSESSNKRGEVLAYSPVYGRKRFFKGQFTDIEQRHGYKVGNAWFKFYEVRSYQGWLWRSD